MGISLVVVVVVVKVNENHDKDYGDKGNNQYKVARLT
jgi:hypothetical protein